MTVAQTKNETLGFKNPVSKCLENKIQVWKTPSLSQVRLYTMNNMSKYIDNRLN